MIKAGAVWCEHGRPSKPDEKTNTMSIILVIIGLALFVAMAFAKSGEGCE